MNALLQTSSSRGKDRECAETTCCTTTLTANRRHGQLLLHHLTLKVSIHLLYSYHVLLQILHSNSICLLYIKKISSANPKPLAYGIQFVFQHKFERQLATAYVAFELGRQGFLDCEHKCGSEKKRRCRRSGVGIGCVDAWRRDGKGMGRVGGRRGYRRFRSVRTPGTACNTGYRNADVLPVV